MPHFCGGLIGPAADSPIITPMPHHTGSFCLTGLLACALGGCAATLSDRERLDASFAPDRAQAVVRLAESHDTQSIHKLVELLQDHDQAVRMVAILALQRLTGETFGYRYYDDAARRGAAVERWRGALREGKIVVRAGSAAQDAAP